MKKFYNFGAWIQTLWYSDDIPKNYFENAKFENNQGEKIELHSMQRFSLRVW